jgi:2-hydroxy-6-oxonona-2,4-dienedioate hydrolase
LQNQRDSMSEHIGRLESRWDVVRGKRLHARVAVEAVHPDAPAVVLVHGLIVSSRYMIPVAQQLAPYYRVYAPDLPGSGKSDNPARTPSPGELANALAAWMDVLGLERAALLANSYGCQVAVEFALRYPARMDRMVLTGPAMDPHASPARLFVRWVSNVTREPPSILPVVARDFLEYGPQPAWETFLLGLRQRVEHLLPAVQQPTLVVRGERDPIAPQQWCEEAAALLPRGRLAVIPRAGHAVNFNSPRELALLTRDFLEDV